MTRGYCDWSTGLDPCFDTDLDFSEYRRKKRWTYDRLVQIMELSNNLLLNETALAALPEHKQPVFVYEWLSFLDKVLPAAQKTDLQQCYKQLVSQLTAQLSAQLSSASRQLLGSCLAQLFSCSETTLLFDTVDRCAEIVRVRDDTPTYLNTKLSALTCLGCMYGRLGRMMGRTYEEIVQLLIKSLRSGEAVLRCEVLRTLSQLVNGMGSAASSLHKDIYKACRPCMTDRAMLVRCAAAECLLHVLDHCALLHGTELDGLVTLCFRALDGSSADARSAISRLLGTLVARTQTVNVPSHQLQQQLQSSSAGKAAVNGSSANSGKARVRVRSLDEALSLLMTGFLKGGSGFLKGTGDMIKGAPAVSRELRIGVTLAYVVFAERLGRLWLERHLSPFISHVLSLASRVRAGSTHVDTVYVRKCVVYILRSTIGQMLGEHAQLSACKDLCAFILPMPSGDAREEASGSETGSSGSLQPSSLGGATGVYHSVTCALIVLSDLCRSLDTSCVSLITDSSVNLLDSIFRQLSHSNTAVRLAAAWCLRSVCVSVPAHLTNMIDRCLEGLAIDTGSGGSGGASTPAVSSGAPSDSATGGAHDASTITGHACAVAALLGAVPLSPLGIPSCRGRQLGAVGEQLLRSALHSAPRLSQARTQAGWLILAAVASLGYTTVKGLLPRLLLLWRNTFPRSAKELESEKSRGDAFTWQVCLESRAGALSAMHSVLLHCGTGLLSDDLIRRLLVPLEAAISMLPSLGSLVKSYGQHLKASVAMVRLRLYEVLSLLPHHALNNSHEPLLRLLVSEFTLATDIGLLTSSSSLTSAMSASSGSVGGGGGGGAGGAATTCTSQLLRACQAEDSVLLTARAAEPQLRSLQQQLEANSAAGSGALEHDITCLFSRRQQYSSVPGPMPLGVAIIDQSIQLFGQMFPYVANKHRLQMFNHFADCIRQNKGFRQEVVQTNIFAAVLYGLRAVVDAKSTVGDDNVIAPARQLVLSCLTSASPVLRLAAAESLGCLGQAVCDPRFVADMALVCYNTLRSARDVANRTGYSMALGCMYRHVGSMMSGNQQLSSSVSILLALAQDMSSPIVQLWSLHALRLMMDAGGPMFRTYVEPLLTLCLRLLLSSSVAMGSGGGGGGGSAAGGSNGGNGVGSVASSQLPRCLAQCLSALITMIGPELHGNGSSICSTRSSLLTACTLLAAHTDPHVRAEAISCLQQLQLFAPRQLSLSLLVPQLCRSLLDEHLVVRRAAVSCLRQVTQREAAQVCSHAQSFASDSDIPLADLLYAGKPVLLPALLMRLVGAETDECILIQLHDTVQAMMSELVSQQLSSWLQLCRHVLATSSDHSSGSAVEHDESEFVDDMEKFTSDDDSVQHTSAPPSWRARIFAAELLQKILIACQSDCTHVDLTLARQARTADPNSDWLVLHLSDLVRMAFIAATSDFDQLRLVGLSCFHQLIELFGKTIDPEFPQQLLLQQYQAQVSSALRPAFAADTPSHITARAASVCSAWICSGVTRDLSDLKRVHQLMVFCLSKLRSHPSLVYNESAQTLEQLAILRSWAEMYITAIKAEQADRSDNEADISSQSGNSDELGGNHLLQLVEPELATLSKHWLAALKDHALLSLPPEFGGRLGTAGSSFFTVDTVSVVRSYYKLAWPNILQATALWLNRSGFDSGLSEKVDRSRDEDQSQGTGSVSVSDRSDEEINVNRFHLLFGVCMEAMCDSRGDHSPATLLSCVWSLVQLLSSGWSRHQLTSCRQLQLELLTAVQRLLLVYSCHDQLCRQILKLVVLVAQAEQERLAEMMHSRDKDLPCDNRKASVRLSELGEGDSCGEFEPGQSVVLPLLQLVHDTCRRVCQHSLMPATSDVTTNVYNMSNCKNSSQWSSDSEHINWHLLSHCSSVLSTCLSLCAPRAAPSLLPAVLYLVTGMLRCVATAGESSWPAAGGDVGGETALEQTLTSLLATLSSAFDMISYYTEQSRRQYCEYLESAWAAVLQMFESGGGVVHQQPLLSTLCHFVTSAPDEVRRCHQLQESTVLRMVSSLTDSDYQVRLHTVLLCDPIFSQSTANAGCLSTPYIVRLAPILLKQLHSCVAPDNQLQLKLVEQQLVRVRQLLAVCRESAPDSQGFPEGRLLSLYLCALVRFLLDSEGLSRADQYQTSLHHTCIDQLNSTAQLFPQLFKGLLNQSIRLRRHIESALRASNNAEVPSKNSNSTARAPHHTNIQPSIKLTTDFSKFS